MEFAKCTLRDWTAQCQVARALYMTHKTLSLPTQVNTFGLPLQIECRTALHWAAGSNGTLWKFSCWCSFLPMPLCVHMCLCVSVPLYECVNVPFLFVARSLHLFSFADLARSILFWPNFYCYASYQQTYLTCRLSSRRRDEGFSWSQCDIPGAQGASISAFFFENPASTFQPWRNSLGNPVFQITLWMAGLLLYFVYTIPEGTRCARLHPSGIIVVHTFCCCFFLPLSCTLPLFPESDVTPFFPFSKFAQRKV